MAFKYTEEQLNKLDKELLIQLFLGMQDQLEEALFHRHLLQLLSMVSMSMPFRFTAWKKNSSGMGWLLPGRTWPTG